LPFRWNSNSSFSFAYLCVPLRETHPIFANPGFRQIHRAQMENPLLG
jgi:hypothetical protein